MSGTLAWNANVSLVSLDHYGVIQSASVGFLLICCIAVHHLLSSFIVTEENFRLTLISMKHIKLLESGQIAAFARLHLVNCALAVILNGVSTRDGRIYLLGKLLAGACRRSHIK